MMILLQIYFTVAASTAESFEQMYQTSYRPALRKQEGYQSSRLLRIFEPSVAEAIQAAPTSFNYQLELCFSSEEARREWVNSPDHQEVWPLAVALSTAAEWCGYDIIHEDKN
jgi:heme-degrading monooxygenase HmoA